MTLSTKGPGCGGARPGAGRKKSSSAAPKTKGQGRGGARRGAGRKSKTLSAFDQTALLDHLYRSTPPAEVDRYFALARAGDIVALVRLLGFYSKAEKAAKASYRSAATASPGFLFDRWTNDG